MWWFLVLLGILIALAGVAVIALGVAISLSFGNTLITTGAVAASGGLVITAMGLVLRQLERLTARLDEMDTLSLGHPEAPIAEEAMEMPAPRAARPNLPRLTPEDLLPPQLEEEQPLEQGLEPDLIHEPPALRAPMAPPPPERPQDRLAADRLSAERLSPERLSPERAPLERPTGRGRSADLLPPLPGLSEEPAPPSEPSIDAMQEARRARLERRGEFERRIDTEGRVPPRPRGGFEPPPRPAPAGGAGRASLAPPAPSAPPRRPEPPAGEPTVLKSGIVGGMAYTLYSDGSIQAELPDGVVRFASLQELRDHVAQAHQGR